MLLSIFINDKNISATSNPSISRNETSSMLINATTKLSLESFKVDCDKHCPCSVVPKIPVPDQVLEVFVAGGFKVWHIVFIVIALLLSTIVVYCCFHRCRIPRTKQEIEADLLRTTIANKFREHLKNLPIDISTFADALKKVQELEEKYEQEQADAQGTRKRLGWLKSRNKDDTKQQPINQQQVDPSIDPTEKFGAILNTELKTKLRNVAAAAAVATSMETAARVKRSIDSDKTKRVNLNKQETKYEQNKDKYPEETQSLKDLRVKLAESPKNLSRKERKRIELADKMKAKFERKLVKMEKLEREKRDAEERKNIRELMKKNKKNEKSSKGDANMKENEQLVESVDTSKKMARNTETKMTKREIDDEKLVSYHRDHHHSSDYKKESNKDVDKKTDKQNESEKRKKTTRPENRIENQSREQSLSRIKTKDPEVNNLIKNRDKTLESTELRESSSNKNRRTEKQGLKLSVRDSTKPVETYPKNKIMMPDAKSNKLFESSKASIMDNDNENDITRNQLNTSRRITKPKMDVRPKIRSPERQNFADPSVRAPVGFSIEFNPVNSFKETEKLSNKLHKDLSQQEWQDKAKHHHSNVTQMVSLGEKVSDEEHHHTIINLDQYDQQNYKKHKENITQNKPKTDERTIRQAPIRPANIQLEIPTHIEVKHRSMLQPKTSTNLTVPSEEYNLDSTTENIHRKQHHTVSFKTQDSKQSISPVRKDKKKHKHHHEHRHHHH